MDSRQRPQWSTLGDLGPLVKFEDSDIAVHRLPAATLSEISALAGCCVVFLPADPARTGRVAFWYPDGSSPPDAPGTVGELTVAGADVQPYAVPSRILSVRDALPVLTRARTAAHASAAASFWGRLGCWPCSSPPGACCCRG